MRISPLQLESYFVPRTQLLSNPKFDSEKQVELRHEHFMIKSDATRMDDSRRWTVTLGVAYEAPPELNVPYKFVVEIMGAFLVLEGYPSEREELLVRTNGPSVLYGIAREIVRELCARGPYPGLMLPSASFVQETPAVKEETRTEEQASASKAEH